MPPAVAARPVISQAMTKVWKVPVARQLTALATLRAWLSAIRCLHAYVRSVAQHCPPSLSVCRISYASNSPGGWHHGWPNHTAWRSPAFSGGNGGSASTGGGASDGGGAVSRRRRPDPHHLHGRRCSVRPAAPRHAGLLRLLPRLSA